MHFATNLTRNSYIFSLWSAHKNIELASLGTFIKSILGEETSRHGCGILTLVVSLGFCGLD